MSLHFPSTRLGRGPRGIGRNAGLGPPLPALSGNRRGNRRPGRDPGTLRCERPPSCPVRAPGRGGREWEVPRPGRKAPAGSTLPLAPGARGLRPASLTSGLQTALSTPALEAAPSSPSRPRGTSQAQHLEVAREPETLLIGLAGDWRCSPYMHRGKMRPRVGGCQVERRQCGWTGGGV